MYPLPYTYSIPIIAATALSPPNKSMPCTAVPAAMPVKGGTDGVGVAVALTVTLPVPFAVYVGG